MGLGRSYQLPSYWELVALWQRTTRKSVPFAEITAHPFDIRDQIQQFVVRTSASKIQGWPVRPAGSPDSDCPQASHWSKYYVINANRVGDIEKPQSDPYLIFWDAGNGGKLMPNIELEIAKHQVSELRVRLLQQQSIVLGLRREGGEKLAEATALLNSAS